jgi:TetR/AcrR family transcriptional regulator
MPDDSDAFPGLGSMTGRRRRAHARMENRAAILEAALEVFSTHGFRGATLDQIAETAQISKPLVLYYFPSKEAIHAELLDELLDTWLNPLRDMNPDGDPITEIVTYVRRKLHLSRDFPRESRLFANEVMQGAPRLEPVIHAELKPLVDEKVAVIRAWAEAGRIAPVDPHHLIFSVWALTQHYADFDMQVRAVLGPEVENPYPDALAYLETLYRKMLAV